MARVRRAFERSGPPGPATYLLPRRGAPSAVLVPIFEEDGGARVILTRRSSRLRSHTGQVAFPGGRLEVGEAPVAAALREASEEVGLDPAVCEILGELTPLATLSSGAHITPFVAALPGRPHLSPQPSEVERVFDVALAELMDPSAYRSEIWPFEGGERPMYVFELDGDTVWGATARILVELLDLVTLL